MREDGRDGVCQPDDSDPNALECDDDWGGDGDADDEDACAGLSEGDACVRDDGRDGVCQPDDSDPNALECDDDLLGDGGDGDDQGGGGGDADREACLGHAEGDACVDHNGDNGVCLPDDSDPNELKCED